MELRSNSFSAVSLRVELVNSNQWALLTRPNTLDYACDTPQWRVLKMWSEDGKYFSASVDGVVFADHLGGLNDACSV